MVLTQGAALQLFVNRLTSRSVLTDEEVSAVLGLKGDVRKIAATSTICGMVNRSVILVS